MTATTPINAPFNAQMTVAVDRAVVCQRHRELVTGYRKINGWRGIQ